MVNMTVAIPAQAHKVMKMHKEIKWTEVARSAVLQKINELELAEKDPLRLHAYKRWAEEGEDAHKFFDF